jgi:hypothetical protein
MVKCHENACWAARLSTTLDPGDEYALSWQPDPLSPTAVQTVLRYREVRLVGIPGALLRKLRRATLGLESFTAGDNAHKKGMHPVLYFISFYFVIVRTLTKAFTQTLKNLHLRRWLEMHGFRIKIAKITSFFIFPMVI